MPIRSGPDRVGAHGPVAPAVVGYRPSMRHRMVALALALVACRGGGSSKSEPRERTPTPAPETQTQALRPDSEYPTPAMSGTEELFLIEEPPRGPHVTNVRVPDRSQLRFAEHAYCEVGPTRLACSPARPKAGSAA